MTTQALDARSAARFLRVGLRYGFSSVGPIAVSGAHFFCALVFLRNLGAREFGLFSFVLVIVPFCMSLSNALLVVPVSTSLKAEGLADEGVTATCLKMNLMLTALAGASVTVLLLLSRADPSAAVLLGLFGAALTYRWFARCFAYVNGRPGAAIASDLMYGAGLTAGIGALLAYGHLTLVAGAAALLAAAVAGLAPFGESFFREQLRAMVHARLADYAALWRALTRWSLLGVLFTEMTVNAHAYLVTFISGPQSFALLALGMLLMRPASLVQSALPDMERPVMTRAIAAKDMGALLRTAEEFRAGLLTVWLATVGLAAALLHWFPATILKKGYDFHSVVIVMLLSAAIVGIRSLRTPPSVLLQAAGEFKALAGIGTLSSALSIAATLVLLLVFGPVASLGGIVAGELVILVRVYRLAENWKRTNHA